LLWIVPLASLLVVLAAQSLPRTWEALDLDPTPLGYMRMTAFILTCVVCGFLLVWFFGFTRVRRRVKLMALLVLALLGGGLAASVEEMTLTANLWPSFRFRWQKSGEARLAEFQESSRGAAAGLPTVDLTIDPVVDFPRYRGPRADGVVHPSDLLDLKWENARPKELWRHPCGGGFSGFAVAGNAAVTMEQRGPDEAVVCYDRATGVERWAYAYPALFKDTTGNGPRATPTVADGEVYALGALGDLVCLDGASGAKKWAVNILADNQAKVVSWGMTGSPLVTDELVIVNAGVDPANNAGRAVAAYRRKDGQRVWAAGTHKAGYGSPQLATLAGRRQVLLFDAGGLAGFDLEAGRELWRHPWETYQDMNIAQPLLFDDDRVFLSSEVNNGCAMVRVTRKGGGYAAEVVWENRYLAARQVNPVRVGNHIYGMGGVTGMLVCLEAETGRRRWRGKAYGQGQILAVAGTLLVQSEQGDLAVVPADPERFREAARMTVFPNRRTWNTPALAGRQLFLRNDEEMVCLELPLRE
jgi:outer membrane protein assembly factor BamB